MFRFLTDRLQNKLILAFVLALIIPTAIIAVYTITSQSEALIEEAQVGALAHNRGQSNLLELAFNRAIPDVVFYAQSTSAAAYAQAILDDSPTDLEIARSRLNTSFSAFARSVQTYDQISVLNTRGDEVVRVKMVSGSPAAVPAAELQNHAGRDYFEQAIKLPNGEVYVSALSLNVENGVIEEPYKPIIRFSTPIYADNGRVVGVVVMNMLGSTFLSLLSENLQGETAYLIDRDGTYLAGPDASKLYARDLGGSASFFDDFPQTGAAILAADEGTAFGNADYPDQLLTYTRVSPPGLEGIRWTLLHTRPLSAVLEKTENVRSVIGGIAILSALAAAAFMVVLTNSITRPLARLAQAAQEIGAGRLDTPVPHIAGRDEIAQLRSAFSQMAEDLRTTYANMEDTIASRTRDLQTVAEVNSQIATILQPDRLLQDIADLTKERFRLYHAHVYLLDDAGLNLRLTAGAGHVGRQMVAKAHVIDLNHPSSIVAQAARSRRAVVVNDVTTSPTFLPNPLLPDTRSELAVPLIARGQVLGVLDVQSNQRDYFTDDVVTVMELLAGQVATALSNARLYDVASRTSRHERALGSIDRRIQEATTMDDILQTAVRELGKALRVPHTAIELRLPTETNGSMSAEEEK